MGKGKGGGGQKESHGTENVGNDDLLSPHFIQFPFPLTTPVRIQKKH